MIWELRKTLTSIALKGHPLKFQKLHDENIFSNLNELKINKFNFFTSRFFSAVDIELESKPAVIIVSDVKFAMHSMINPETEVVQIAGRFRNGIKSITHITNTDSDLPEKSLGDLKFRFNESEKAYSEMRNSYNKAPNEYQKKVWKNALERVDFAKYLTSYNEINWFKLDNELANQRMINSYLSESDLATAYRNSRFFNIEPLNYYDHPFKDRRIFRVPGGIVKSICKDIVAELDKLDLSRVDDNIFEIERLKSQNPLVVSAYFELGKDFIEEVNYDANRLWIALEKKENGISNTAFHNAISEMFTVNWSYAGDDIKKKLNQLYQEFGIVKNAKATDLEKYFELSKRKTIRQYGEEPKGYTIIRAKFPKSNPGTKFDYA